MSEQNFDSPTGSQPSEGNFQGDSWPEDKQLKDQFDQLVAGLDPVEMGEPEFLEPPVLNLDEPELVSPEVTEKRCLAVFLTPVASSEALGGLCALEQLDLQVAGSTTGAFAFTEVQLDEEAWRMVTLLGADTPVPELDELGQRLSVITQCPVLLMFSLLIPDSQLDQGVSGQVVAKRFVKGKFETMVSAGLAINEADPIIEEVLLGRLDPAQLTHTLQTKTLGRFQALRMLGKGLRRPKKERREERNSGNDVSTGSGSDL